MGEHRPSLSATRQHPFSRDLSPAQATANRSPIRLALGLAGALIWLGSPAHAQDRIFWSDVYPDAYIEPDTYIEAPPRPPAARRRPHRTKHHRLAKSEAAVKGFRKPKGPLIIAISIDRQTLKIYDANGFFAETPVSTGMRGHSTPLGVFSVIQKQKWHRSNIYSGAPMPYMQRITWSGIAMHAGVLPGYPASHGCIRMPMSFAVKMWGWTRMGARVIITPGEVTPADFSHPMLITHRPEPVSVASVDLQSDASPLPKTDKDPATTQATAAETAPQSATENAKLEVGNTAAAAPSNGETRTADASGALPQLPASSGAIDPPGATTGQLHSADAADTSELRSGIGPEAKSAEPTSDQPKPAAASEGVPGDTKSLEANPAETNATGTVAETGVSDHPSDQQTAATLPPTDAIRSDADKAEDAKIAAAPVPAVTSDADKADKTGDESKPRTVDATPAADVAALAKDQSQMSPIPASPAKTKPIATPAPKRAGQIAVFVSRKDSKIYVRQNFAPLFDSPVTITTSDRPLGTHVFTAEADKNDKDNFHWSVVSLPVIAHRMERASARGNSSHRRRAAAQTEPKQIPSPDSAAEALNRITIPEDVMSKIAESLSTGGSIVVSDQGVAGGETGEGTDFIVTLR